MVASAITYHWKMFQPKYIFQKLSHSILIYVLACVPRDKCITDVQELISE